MHQCIWHVNNIIQNKIGHTHNGRILCHLQECAHIFKSFNIYELTHGSTVGKSWLKLVSCKHRHSCSSTLRNKEAKLIHPAGHLPNPNNPIQRHQCWAASIPNLRGSPLAILRQYLSQPWVQRRLFRHVQNIGGLQREATKHKHQQIKVR